MKKYNELETVENKNDRCSWMKFKYKHEYIYTKSTK